MAESYLQTSLQKGQVDLTCQVCKQNPRIKWKCKECNLTICVSCKGELHSKCIYAKYHNIVDLQYQERIILTGEGLQNATVGNEADFNIDLRHLLSISRGDLNVSCVGPTDKNALYELTDNKDGSFKLTITAKENGRHLLQIKSGGDHVQGSPFVIRVREPPDPSEVLVTGPGIKHGLLSTFQGKFSIGTIGAGPGQLTVIIRGPKGSFEETNLSREKQSDRTITCEYNPTDSGIYRITVQWSGVDVPGSPFIFYIVETPAELEEIVRTTLS